MPTRPQRVTWGKRPTSSGLIREIELKRRRDKIRRLVQAISVLLLLVVGVQSLRCAWQQRSERDALQAAWLHYRAGTWSDVSLAARTIEDRGLADGSTTAGVLALLRAHEVLEFGERREEAVAAVAAAEGSPSADLAQAMLQLAAGQPLTVEEAIAAHALVDAPPLVRGEAVWLRAVVALTQQDPAALGAALESVDAFIAAEQGTIVHRRIRVYLLMAMGRQAEAFEALEILREDAPEHVGLAADEVFFNAWLHRNYGGVSSVAQQILATEPDLVSAHTESLARLARAVVKVRRGEPEDAIEQLRTAWPVLPAWLPTAQSLALQTALEAGATADVTNWLPEARLDETRKTIFGAWLALVNGDFRRSLDTLAKLPQDDHMVGFLQALALVEQGRHEEAEPWLDRVAKLWPGHVEIEIARARVALRRREPAVAHRKLQALAEQEAYAPRAWTGLGEAYLLSPTERDLDQAQAAFEKAASLEPLPAEALLQLAELKKRQRATHPHADEEALELFEKAARTNPHWPRYREALALHLVHLGREAEAKDALQALVDVPGVTWEVPLALARLDGEATDESAAKYLELATKLGASSADVAVAKVDFALRTRDAEALAALEAELAPWLERAPTEVAPRVAYALVKLAQGDDRAAELTVRKGLRVVPEHDHGRLYFAWAKVDQARTRNTLAAARSRSAWLKMVAEGRPAAELLEVAEFATTTWQTKLDNDRVALAIARQLTNAIGYRARAWVIRAQVELTAAETESARESATKAVELDARNAQAHLLLGHARLRYGQRAEAKQAYAKAVELAEGTTDEPTYRAYLAKL